MSELEHKEVILCPNCGAIEVATVQHLTPWNSYVHTCSRCDYEITESEWEEFKKLKEIKFDNNYPKLNNQKHARLVFVIQGLLGEMLLKNFPDLTYYDTLRDDGVYYDIKNNESYMLLFFVGEKGIMFSTLRKQNEENAILYAESVGEVYKIKIEPKGVKYGS